MTIAGFAMIAMIPAIITRDGLAFTTLSLILVVSLMA